MRPYGKRVTARHKVRHTARHTPPRQSELIPASEWHPLDGVPAPEYVPPVWDGPHVGLRLIGAFKTLARLPMPRMSTASGYWPQYRHEWIDLLAQAPDDAESKALLEQQRNRTRALPSAAEISAMEAAIAWPGRYLAHRPLMMRIVHRVAIMRSRDVELEVIATRLGRSPIQVRRINRTGLDVIADGLRRDRAPVF